MSAYKRPRLGDVLVVGFAMFATFFGAGNMIFPPFLGNQSGESWFLGFLCFILADAGLAFLTVFAMARSNGTIWSLFARLSKIPRGIITIGTMAIVGPLLCIPRTCATTFEMAVLPFFPDFSRVIFGILFFGIVYLLIIRRSAVVDIIGKYMTPILLLSLAVLVIVGIVRPLGPVAAPARVNVIREGFLAGYQTMDVLGALAFTIVVLHTIRSNGYHEHRSSLHMVSRASLVAAAGLFTVYGGLTYLGATTSSMRMMGLNQAALLVDITDRLLGSMGKALLALMVLLACMTTAVGLASAATDFFYELWQERIKYSHIVAGVCIISLVISVIGISTMIALAEPMLNILYPLLLTQIFLSFFAGKIRKDSVFRGAALGALIVCILTVAADYGAPTNFVNLLPLGSIGLSWVLPSALGAAIGGLLPERKILSNGCTNENLMV